MKLLNGGSQKKRMNNLSNHKIIPYPTKKVVTKFYFVSGEKLEVVSANNCNLEEKKERTANLVSSSYYVKFTAFIVSTNHITHITFEYDDDEDEEKPKVIKSSVKDIFSVISKILGFILLCMSFVYVAVCLCIIFKK